MVGGAADLAEEPFEFGDVGLGDGLVASESLHGELVLVVADYMSAS